MMNLNLELTAEGRYLSFFIYLKSLLINNNKKRFLELMLALCDYRGPKCFWQMSLFILTYLPLFDWFIIIAGIGDYIFFSVFF